MIGEYFTKLRHDPNHHLGLGDIRLTVAQQHEIEVMYNKLKVERGKYKEAKDLLHSKSKQMCYEYNMMYDKLKEIQSNA